MLIFMLPMVGLYFVGIGVSAMVVRNKRKRLETEKNDESKLEN
jgi:Sec-independent protein secretion pathway component TatC